MKMYIKNPILFRMLRKKFSNSDRNYAKNSSVEKDFHGYVYGQNLCPNFSVGNAAFKDVGCEVAAVYNSLKFLEKKRLISEIIKTFEDNGYLMSGKTTGDFGTDPYALGDYFKQIGQNFVKCLRFKEVEKWWADNAEKNEIYIVSFWNGPKLKNGVHTVACYRTPDTNGVYIYNFSNSCKSPTHRYHIGEFATKNRFLVAYKLI